LRYELFLFFSLIVLGTGVAFKIYDFIYVSLAFLLFILIDYTFLFFMKPRFYFESPINNVELFRGEEVEIPLYYSYNKKIKIISPYNFVSLIINTKSDFNKFRINLKIRGLRSGIYEINKLHVLYRSILFEKKIEVLIRPKIRLTVYPKSFLLFKELQTYFSKGFTSQSNIIGRGEEFAYTDKFNSNDDFRRIDWKKTAKYNDIMVKRYYWDLYGNIGIIIDLESTDENSADDLATEALNLIKYSNLFQGNIYVYDGQNIKNLRKDVYSAFIYIVDMMKKYYPEINRVLDFKDIYDYLKNKKKDNFNTNSIEDRYIILTQILSELAFKYPKAYIIQPTKPWVYIDDIETSYNIRKMYEKNLNKIKELGSKVFSSFNEIAGGVIEFK